MKRFLTLLGAMLLSAMLIQPRVYAAVITIDGVFGDWAGTAGQVDIGSADDEASPARADITEYRIDATTTDALLLMAWDDTEFNGGNASTAGMSVKGANGTTYRIYVTASGSPGSIAASSIVVERCSDSTCGSQTVVCDNATASPCAGVASASGVTWIDPFATRSNPRCSGASCGTRDTAVEIRMPWSLIGGLPGTGQYAFFQFGSYPSGPGQGPKDSVPMPSGNGVSCLIVQGQLTCKPTTPTAIQLTRFTATWQLDHVALSWQTATEQRTLGFYLLRSTTGQRTDAQRITPDLITAAGDDVTGATYDWADYDVARDGVYRYWLQEVETDNTINEYGPIVFRGPDAPPLHYAILPTVYR